jgi:hypothetical protein
MPMWRSPKTIRSPAAGVVVAGRRRPVREAQSAIAATEAEPLPPSPTGTPAWAAAQEANVAHHGWPAAEPATAVR